MTAAEIRNSFLDFFREKQHTIVPSASLLPQSPGLLFTNAGMNPFVPYFLGVEKAPYDPPRAADTQKCIRAGGKHNDLEDVGYDTYHHTFFEMLGNWSFGNYFKKEAISWAWELVVERWGLPANRLYASVYAPKPGDPGEFDQEAYEIWAELFKSKGCDPAVQIVHGNVKDNFWMMGDTGPCGPCSELHVDLTPEGNPVTGRNLVNNDSDLCIEIWNLVFIQYNAEPDGPEEAVKMQVPGSKVDEDWKRRFVPLPARHVDTGMGFERACSIIQNTKGFTDFSKKPSNYATDVFQPIFRKLEELSGKTYSNIYPALGADRSAFDEEMKDAIAFRVIADHLRTLSFSIADGIMPGPNGRNYVLRRILRRAVKYGRQLGFSNERPVFKELVSVLVAQLGDVFPELKSREESIISTLEREEATFNEKLDKGLIRFESYLERRAENVSQAVHYLKALLEFGVWNGEAISEDDIPAFKDAAGYLNSAVFRIQNRHDSFASPEEMDFALEVNKFSTHVQNYLDSGGRVVNGFDGVINSKILNDWLSVLEAIPSKVNGECGFGLYDTYGFPVDLTKLLIKEVGLSINEESFDRRVEELMAEQQEKSRAAQKTTVVRALDISTEAVTEFSGFESDEVEATVLEIHPQEDSLFVITDKTVFYAEMGGQAGDTGIVAAVSNRQAEIPVTGVQQIGKARAHVVDASAGFKVGDKVILKLDTTRRRPIEANHSATHLLHWALHEVVSKDAAQQGSSVDENRLRFDFNSAAVTPEQLAAMEEAVNAKISANDAVSWKEVPHAEVKGRADVMQFFGDKYGDVVRVVQIGGGRGELNGYSQELCGGTHVRNTGEIGLFKVRSEGAIASGVRRIEAVTGDAALQYLRETVSALSDEFAATEAKLAPVNAKLAGIGEGIVNIPVPPVLDADTLYKGGITAINRALGEARRSLDESKDAVIEAEKRFKKLQAGAAAKLADESLAELIAKGEPIVATFESDASLLQELQNGLKKKNFTGAALVVVDDGEKLHLAVHCGPDAQAKGLNAGALLRDFAAIAGGKGGGKPDQARGAAPDRSKLDEVKAAANGAFSA